MLRKFLSDTSGATAIEYGLIASLIGLATALEDLWGDNNSKIGVALQ